MRKTARVSFIVEYDEEDYSQATAICADLNLNLPSTLKLYGDAVQIVQHTRPFLDLSAEERSTIYRGIEARGGSFMRVFKEVLTRADSVNMGRLNREFWNELSTYLPEEIK